MKRYLWIIALFCLLLPGAITYCWFYTGPTRNAPPVLPNYSDIDFPRPVFSTEIPLPGSPQNPETVVLFDLQHQNQYSISEIDPLVRSIEAFGGEIKITSEQTNLETSLKSADVFLSVAPMMRFTQQEITLISDFVDRGGKLIVITDPTRNSMSAMPMGDTGASPVTTMLSGTDNANLLLEPYNIAFKDDYLYNLTENEGNFRNIFVTEFANDNLTRGIKKMVVYGGHSVTSSGIQIARTNGKTLSSTNEGNETFSVIDFVKYGEGSVLAIGDLSLITPEYVLSADNQIFVQNLAKYTTAAPRLKTLRDYPALFSGNVILQPTGNIEVTGELLSAVSNLESYLQLSPGNLTISKTERDSTSRIVLSTFTETKTTADILKQLKINLTPATDKDREETIEETEPTASATPGSNIKPELTKEVPPIKVTPEYESTLQALFNNEDETQTGPEIIEVPYFDRVKTKELGLIGLTRSGNKITVIVMASSPAKIQTFIRNLSISGLSGCVIHEDLAACKVTDFAGPPQG